MTQPSHPARGYDLAIAIGTAVSLYWSLYAQPSNGEVLALLLGSVPVTVGLYRYVDPRQYVVEGLVGLLAVSLGGMAPASVLVGTGVGRWLVGDSPLPLALGIAALVVLGAVVLRRLVGDVVRSSADAPA